MKKHNYLVSHDDASAFQDFPQIQDMAGWRLSMAFRMGFFEGKNVLDIFRTSL
jgi:hypothetical protein